MLNGSFLLMRSLSKILLFLLSTSNANAPACKVVVNGARVGLVKNQIVIVKFSVTYVISQHIYHYIGFVE